MRVLVLGGTGFIGPYVVRRLAERGHQVTVMHRGKHEADLPSEVKHLHHASLTAGDRRGLAELADEFRRGDPDVVLDMIPATEDDAQALMHTFRGIARRVVAISSQDVYRVYGRLHQKEPGPPDPVPLDEDAPLRERLYPYRGDMPRSDDDAKRWLDDYDKILVERAVMGQPDLPGTVLRLPAVYGPGDQQRRLFNYLKRIDDGRPGILLAEDVAQWRWTRGYVENMAEAIALAVVDGRAAGRVYNVADPVAFTEAECVRAIGRAAGWTGKVVVVPRDRVPKHLAWSIDTNHHMVADITRIRCELAYTEVVPQEEALRRTIAWERAHPPEQIDPERFDYAAEDSVLAALACKGT